MIFYALLLLNKIQSYDIPSLMLSTAELEQIRAAQKGNLPSEERKPSKELENFPLKEDLELVCNGILYLSPQHWTVWINQQDYHTLGPIHEGPHITEVTNDFIRLKFDDKEWKLKTSSDIKHPEQTKKP